MSKNIYFVLIAVWVVGWLILYFQNTIFSYTLYSPFGPKASSLIILYSLSLWFLAWFWICGITQARKDDEYEDEHF